MSKPIVEADQFPLPLQRLIDQTERTGTEIGEQLVANAFKYDELSRVDGCTCRARDSHRVDVAAVLLDAETNMRTG